MQRERLQRRQHPSSRLVTSSKFHAACILHSAFCHCLTTSETIRRADTTLPQTGPVPLNPRYSWHTWPPTRVTFRALRTQLLLPLWVTEHPIPKFAVPSSEASRAADLRIRGKKKAAHWDGGPQAEGHIRGVAHRWQRRIMSQASGSAPCAAARRVLE